MMEWEGVSNISCSQSLEEVEGRKGLLKFRKRSISGIFACYSG